MDYKKSKVQPPRRFDPGAGPKAPMARGGVLDLRQNRPAAAPKPPSLAESLEASAVPATPHHEAVAPANPAPTAPTVSPLEVSPATAVVSPVADASLRPRRFWPAFWRFLVLLIVFGALVTGGVYLYLTYVKH